ncbi:MAG: gamma-glutamyltranspeptidase/glutathione hydrolase [Myxococcota bacterium]|jgi:gamma-glutamyltranspeptidase/glutathione hydrolase
MGTYAPRGTDRFRCSTKRIHGDWQKIPVEHDARACRASKFDGATSRTRTPMIFTETLRSRFTVLHALVFLLAMGVPVMTQAQTPASMAGRSTVYAPNGAVATSQPLATSAALRVLEDGGNAIDAAVVAAAILGVVEPHMTSMGGDMFALFWSAAEQRLVGLDGSGKAGSLIDADALLAAGHERMPGAGAEAITVPGAVSGWNALLESYGTLSLKEALEPARRIAAEGFPVTPIIARQWAAQTEKLKRDPGATATYLIDGERAPVAGEWMTNPGLAESYRILQEGGASALYGGALGETLAEFVQSQGGFLTVADFANHSPRWVEPLSVDFHGYTVWELPPSGQGIAALQMLRLLEPFDLVSMGHNSAEYLHHFVEAKKLAYEDLRKYVADPEWMTTSPQQLLSDEYIDERRSLMNPKLATDREDPDAAVQQSETIYLSVADQHGNMVSFINSVFGYFGSGLVAPGTGVILQNRGAGFTLEAGHPNRAAPGKRPFHTIIPGFVTKDGEPYMAFGLMGGAMQPQGHAQMLSSLLLFDMDPQAAVDVGRFRHMSGRRLALEPSIPESVRAQLRAMGHDVMENQPDYGGAQLVIRLTRGWAAASDPRKDGHAAGN